MTKKNYIKAAELVRNTKGAAAARAVYLAFVAFFKEDNVAFDEDRFRAACAGATKPKARGTLNRRGPAD